MVQLMNTLVTDASRLKFAELLDQHRFAPNAVIYTAIGSVVGVSLSYLFNRWARRSPRLKATMDSMYVGYSIAGAQASLDEIDEFAREREEQPSSAPRE
jgi:hypothetical protein